MYQSKNRISILPELVINQIAAGEVIERPASILKELLENSIDANSSMVRIYLDNGGIGGIKVVDNGIGIHPDDISLVFKQHATSKIKDINDLNLINSLGFRGEALASIAAISVVNIITSQAEPSGTTIEVKDIFYNLPVRKKFLRSGNTEFNYIQEMFKRIALSNFAIGFILYNNNKLVKSLPAIVNMEVEQDLDLKEQRIAKLLGSKFIENAFFFNIKANNLQLYGWIGNVYNVSGSQIQYFYLNNRIVKDKLLNAAIKQAIQELSLPTAYCLYFKLNPMLVDVNVHPTKQEVRFSEPKIIFAFIYESILDAFRQFKVKNAMINQENLDNYNGNYNGNGTDNYNDIDNKNNSVDHHNNNQYDNYCNKTYYQDYSVTSDTGESQVSGINDTSDAGNVSNVGDASDASDAGDASDTMVEKYITVKKYITNAAENINLNKSNINLKIFPVFNNKYVLFVNNLTTCANDLNNLNDLNKLNKLNDVNSLLVLNVEQGLKSFLSNNLMQPESQVSYNLIIPQRVKLIQDISVDFQVVESLLKKLKFEVMQIHANILLINSIPECLYAFEIQVDYVKFFNRIFKMQQKCIELSNKNIVDLLMDCVDFRDLAVYTHKDLIKLIEALIKQKFVFYKLTQNMLEKLV